MKRNIILLSLAFMLGFFASVVLLNYTEVLNSYNTVNREYLLSENKASLEKPNKADYLKFKKKYLLPSNDKHFAIAIILGCGLSGYVLYLISKDEKRGQNKDIEGKDRWATKKEILNNKDFSKVNSQHIENAKKTGPLIAKIGKYYIVDTSTTHSLIIGTTRSGKTQTYVLPTLRIMCSGKEKQSFVVNDPKGELLENSYDMLKQNDYNVVVLNLKNTDKTSLWNPLTFIIQKYKQAKDNNLDLSKVNDYLDVMAEVLTQNPKSDPIWPASAKSLLTAMILYLMELGYKTDTLDKVNMYSVYQFFIEYGKCEYENIGGQLVETSKLDKIFQSLPRGNPAKSAYATSNFASGDMKSSIYAVLSENISLWGKDSGIASLTSGDDIDFIKLFSDEKPCAIFMVVPDNRPARHCIASMFVNQCYLALTEYLEERDIPTLPRKVNFILDEFGNMVTIPDMATKITISASRGILFHMFVQDLNQLEVKYGKASKTIQSNCGNLIYIYSLEPDTNKYMSSILGTETLLYSTYSGKESEGLTNRSQQYKGHQLMTPTDLAVLEYGETIIKRQRMYPIRTVMPFFYELNIKPRKISDIPLSNNNRNLSEWIFPFEIVDDENGFQTVIENNPNDNFEQQITKSDVPNKPMMSPDTFVEKNQRQQNNINPIKLAVQRINELTQNQYTELLFEQKFKEVQSIVSQKYMMKQIDKSMYDILITQIENRKTDK